MPQPFQIFQGENAHAFIAYQWAGAVRDIYFDDPGPPQVDSWMGQSVGRWEGDTLVVEANGFHGQAWLDRAGNHTSWKLKVTERYTPMGPDHLHGTRRPSKIRRPSRNPGPSRCRCTGGWNRHIPSSWISSASSSSRNCCTGNTDVIHWTEARVHSRGSMSKVERRYVDRYDERKLRRGKKDLIRQHHTGSDGPAERNWPLRYGREPREAIDRTLTRYLRHRHHYPAATAGRSLVTTSF